MSGPLQHIIYHNINYYNCVVIVMGEIEFVLVFFRADEDPCKQNN